MQGGTRVERPKELQTLVLIEIWQLLSKNNFKKYYEILYVEMFHNRTYQIYCSNFSIYKYMLLWFWEWRTSMVPSIYTWPCLLAMFKSKKCGTLNSVTLSTCMIQSKRPYDASTNPLHGFMETFVVSIYLSIILSQIKPLF